MLNNNDLSHWTLYLPSIPLIPTFPLVLFVYLSADACLVERWRIREKKNFRILDQTVIGNSQIKIPIRFFYSIFLYPTEHEKNPFFQASTTFHLPSSSNQHLVTSVEVLDGIFQPRLWSAANRKWNNVLRNTDWRDDETEV